MTEETQGKKWSKQRRRLTDSWCSSVKPQDKVRRYFDLACPGLFLAVQPSGIKSFGYCASKDGRQTWVTLGRFAPLEVKGQEQATYNVERARRRVDELRELSRNGRDVRAQVKKERTPLLLSALIEVYERDHLPKLKPTTQKSVSSLLACHVTPALGKRMVPEISYEDVDRLHNALVLKGQKVTANRVRSLLSRLFSLATKMGWTPRGFNPAGLVERAPEVPKDRTLSGSDCLALAQALEALRGERGMGPAIIDAVYFCAFSGLRRSEVLALEWGDVDQEAGTMTIRDHKRSRTVGSLVLPLNPQLVAVLQRREADCQADERLAKVERAKNPAKPAYKRPALIFASPRTGSTQAGFSKSWQRVIGKAGLVGITPHDMRRTFMTVCCELGNAPAIGDLLLGHSLGKIRDTYMAIGHNGILGKASQETADRIAVMMGLAGEASE